MTSISTTLIIELSVTVAGVYVPYSPATGPSYASGGEPADGDYCEDVCISGIIASKSGAWDAIKNGHMYTDVDLLASVNTASPDVQTFLSNLLACVEAEAQEELRQQAIEE